MLGLDTDSRPDKLGYVVSVAHRIPYHGRTMAALA